MKVAICSGNNLAWTNPIIEFWLVAPLASNYVCLECGTIARFIVLESKYAL